jgi:Ni/Fe-hydrogenase subunit HybB-like protein
MSPAEDKKRRWSIGTIILTAIALVGLPVIMYRYAEGLGAVSNLSDGRPWGLWISFDLYCGVALAAGGFTLAAVVYIFRQEKYYPVVRSAILTAFLGYTLVILALLIDLGQPWYIWHAIIYWNVHSPLFEVAMCVMTYTVVLALEFSPIVFERLDWKIPMRTIRKIQIPLVIAGIVLSTLHQSSLGSMLLMMPESLNELWYTPILPILFLISAVCVGPAVVIFESTLSGRAFGHKIATTILGGLGKAMPYLLGLYLVIKVGDLLVRGDLLLIFTEDWLSVLWWVEVLGGIVLPLILFTRPSVRESRNKLLMAALLVIGGLILNRFNVSMLALAMRDGYSYFPHWMEFAISACLVSWAILFIIIANRLLPMIHYEEEEEEEEEEKPVELLVSEA